jgi:protein-disulfide isomerase
MTDHHRGDGPLLLVYGDYQCPFTRAAYRTVQLLERDGVALRFAFRHFPLTDKHPHALQAAAAAEAAHEQGRFWPMHDLLFKRQQALGRDDLRAHADELGLDLAAFDTALTSDPCLARVEEDVRSGIEVGVEGTPTLFVDGVRQAGRNAGDLRAALTS